VEILLDWLVHSREKVGGGAEYLLLWGTFLSIVVLGLERGVAAGLFLCVAQFSFAYARVSATASHVAPSRAGAARPPAQRDLLAHFSRHRAAIALSGVIFFGSAFAIGERALEVAAALAADADEAALEEEEEAGAGGGGREVSRELAAARRRAALSAARLPRRPRRRRDRCLGLRRPRAQARQPGREPGKEARHAGGVSPDEQEGDEAARGARL